ncbi:transposase [Streptomyces sp. NPDC058295]|uniref:transposase n=1 Tax=Streptomyces sp. NPDC058295 TaxID=3346431 RepID=UPI0036E9E71F
MEPLLPPATVGPKGGRREKHPRRRIVEAILYVMRTGCSWRQSPNDFAPWPTVYWHFTWEHDDRTVERIHHTMRDQVREADGRNAGPSAGLINSQSVRTADTGPAATRGFEAGKKVKGYSGLSSPTPSVCSWPSMSSRRTFRTAMGAGTRCCGLARAAALLAAIPECAGRLASRMSA